MTKIPRQEFRVLTVFLIIMMFGFMSVHVNPGSTVHIPSRGRKQNLSAYSDFLPSWSRDTTVYMTENITVPGNTTFSIVNEDLIVESLSYVDLGISSSGTLRIVNSTITLSSASYSTVRGFSIAMYGNSRLLVRNSSLVFPGKITLNGTDAVISNSFINSTQTSGSIPYENSLRLEVNGSTLDIYNSTVTGLYRQSGPVEYNDGSLYCYEPGFSQNARVPMAISSSNVEKSLINSVNIRVIYVGNSTENVNNLSVFYNGSQIGTLPLPYLLNQTSREANFTVNFTGTLHPLSWVENSSNFYLVANINFPDAIALSNVTLTLKTNDTVNLYGQEYYSYSISNSSVVFSNDTLGLTQNAQHLINGTLNPFRNSLVASNSTLLIGDTHLSQPGNFQSPFFQLLNSSVYLFRNVRVDAYAGGIPVDNLDVAVHPESWITGYVSDSSMQRFQDILNSTGAKWISSWRNTVLYEYTENGLDWNYTNQFIASYGNDSTVFSIAPFPELQNGSITVNLSTSLPYADFTAENTGITAHNSANLTVTYTGNLSALPSLTVQWWIYSDGLLYLNGNTSLRGITPGNSFTLQLNSTVSLPAGTYLVRYHAASTYPHAFHLAGWFNSSLNVSVPQNVAYYRISINSSGLQKGDIWGIMVNGSDYFSTSSSIVLSISGDQNATVISPSGMNSTISRFTISPSREVYNITFYMQLYGVTFHNTGIGTNSSWEVIIAGHGYRSDTSSITVKLPSGSYNYQIVDPGSYGIKDPAGIINVTESDANVTVVSTVHTTFTGVLMKELSLPQYYIPALVILMIVGSFIAWRGSHRWYVCSNCGSTRKKKNEQCHYCGSTSKK